MKPRKVIQHRQRMARLAANPLYYLDEEELKRIDYFFANVLKHAEAPFHGQPFRLEEWQREEIIKPLLCLKRKSDRTRVFKQALIQIPRKNGKSSITAALALYTMLTDGDGLQHYICASAMKQARIVFNTCRGMIRVSPELSSFLKVMANEIRFPEKSSVLKPLEAKYDSLNGLNAQFICIDEFHTVEREIHDVMVTSVGARKNPLIVKITTAGANVNCVCHDEYEYATRILNGDVQEDSYFCLIYEADKEIGGKPVPYNDERLLWMANPNAGVSCSEEYLRKELKKAEDMPSYRGAFQRFTLNRWVQAGGEKFLPLDKWRANGRAFDPESLQGSFCYAGLDLSSTTDLSALALLFPQEGGEFRLLVHYWIPADNLALRVKEDKVEYDVWEKDGWVETTAGDVIDTDFIAERIAQLHEKYNIRHLAYDPAFGYTIGPRMADYGISCSELRQTIQALHAPTTELEKAVLGGRLIHNLNPVTTYCVSNAEVRRDFGGMIKIEKNRKIVKHRVDGLVASVFAFDAFLRNKEVKETPRFEIPRNFRAMLGM